MSEAKSPRAATNESIEPLSAIAIALGLPSDSDFANVIARVKAMVAALSDPQIVAQLAARERLRERAAAFELAATAGIDVRLAARALREGLSTVRSARERTAIEQALAKLRLTQRIP